MNLQHKKERADSDEFSTLNNSVNFFPNSVTLEEMVDQYGFDYKDPEFASLNNCVIDEEICVEPAAKRQRML